MHASLVNEKFSQKKGCKECNFATVAQGFKITNAHQHDKTNKMSLRPAKTRISLGILLVLSCRGSNQTKKQMKQKREEVLVPDLCLFI